jgi:hypothetical protein
VQSYAFAAAKLRRGLTVSNVSEQPHMLRFHNQNLPIAAFKTHLNFLTRDAFMWKWKKDDSEELRAKAMAAQPVSPKELEQLNQMAEEVVEHYRKLEPEFDYDARSVEFMSAAVTAQRSELFADKEAAIRVANALGAYLGKAAMIWNSGVESRWIKSGSTIGVEFKCGTEAYHAYTISRIFKHIESGEKMSAYQMFEVIEAWVQSCLANQQRQ